MARDYTPYSTVVSLLSQPPAWVNDDMERARVGSYDLYEQIYWCVPDAFELIQRGADDSPIYIPAGRTIVETQHRYLANDLQIIPDPNFGTPEQQQQALAFWIKLARRERFYSKFSANKRMGLIRGDWVFHMRGNPERPEGSRISIETIHPKSLFYIENPEGEIIGWHVVVLEKRGDKEYVKRTTYRKETEQGGPSPISLEIGIYEQNAWGGPGQEKEVLIESIFGPEVFPAPIDQLPIYHIKNFDDTDSFWGSSELRGFERVIAGIDQSISDEELELALNGLGVYTTNSSRPVDASGKPVEWNLGPGRVVEVAAGGDAFFSRVSGTTSVTPHQDHLRYLHERGLDEPSGTPAIAKGRTDVQVAESGIALLMEMGPILSRVAEKETIITDVMVNYMFDLAKWVVAYEGTQWSFLIDQVQFVPIYGEKIPLNRKERFNELLQMATAMPFPLIPLNVFWEEARKIGYDLPEDEHMLQAILEQRMAMSSAEMDSIASRIDTEIAEEGDVEPIASADAGVGGGVAS